MPRPGLDALTHAPLSGNPIPANVFMAVAGTLLCITVAGFVTVKVRVVRNKRLMDKAQNNRRYYGDEMKELDSV